MLANSSIQSIKNMFNEAIDDFGKKITIHYNTSSVCTACTINPLTGESMDSNCSSCGGRGLIYSNRTKEIIGVTRSFLGSFINSTDPTRRQFEWVPAGIARITCELEPILRDYNDPTGDTILSTTDYVEFDGKKFKLKQHDIANIGNWYVVVITLDRFSGNDTEL